MNNEHISKGDRKIIAYVIGTAMLFFLGFVTYTFLNSNDIDEAIKEDRLALSFNGKVDSVYTVKQDHNLQFVLLDNGFNFSLPKRFENKVKVSDSVSKKQGTFYLEVYRRNGTKLTLDYRDTFKKF